MRQRFQSMPLGELRSLAGELQQLIGELEAGPRREIDLIAEHSGDPALVARILRIEGDPKSSNWYQIERIYCSVERCPECPHGDYRFRYQQNKRKKTLKKTFIAKMAFDHETIENIKRNVRPPVATYEIKSPKTRIIL